MESAAAAVLPTVPAMNCTNQRKPPVWREKIVAVTRPPTDLTEDSLPVKFFKPCEDQLDDTAIGHLSKSCAKAEGTWSSRAHRANNKTRRRRQRAQFRNHPYRSEMGRGCALYDPMDRVLPTVLPSRLPVPLLSDKHERRVRFVEELQTLIHRGLNEGERLGNERRKTELLLQTYERESRSSLQSKASPTEKVEEPVATSAQHKPVDSVDRRVDSHNDLLSTLGPARRDLPEKKVEQILVTPLGSLAASVIEKVPAEGIHRLAERLCTFTDHDVARQEQEDVANERGAATENINLERPMEEVKVLRSSVLARSMSPASTLSQSSLSTVINSDCDAQAGQSTAARGPLVLNSCPVKPCKFSVGARNFSAAPTPSVTPEKKGMKRRRELDDASRITDGTVEDTLRTLQMLNISDCNRRCTLCER
eukprot:scpid76246/ scgid30073/ 